MISLLGCQRLILVDKTGFEKGFLYFLIYLFSDLFSALCLDIIVVVFTSYSGVSQVAQLLLIVSEIEVDPTYFQTCKQIRT